jgi:hypothetical protein
MNFSIEIYRCIFIAKELHRRIIDLKEFASALKRLISSIIANFLDYILENAPSITDRKYWSVD